MELKIFNEKEQTTKKINFEGIQVKDILNQLKINPETVLVVRNGEVITEEENLNDKDFLELLSVISGG